MNHDMTLCDGKGCKAAGICRRHRLYRSVSGDDAACRYGFYCLSRDKGTERCELYCRD